MLNPLLSQSLALFVLLVRVRAGSEVLALDPQLPSRDEEVVSSVASSRSTSEASSPSAVHSAPRSNKDWSGEGCPPPTIARRNGSQLSRDRLIGDYATVMEVKFPGEIGPLGGTRLCKIKCVEGKWVGPLCLAEGEDGGRFHPLLRSCRLERIPRHILVTYRNVTITEIGAWFPHGATVAVRCNELGVYKLLGESSMECRNGAWSSRVPACVPTTLLTNYSEGAPPTVLVRIPSGSASAEPSGDLAVFPGTILHLECLFSRKLGNPEWTWTSTFRHYLTGWAIAPEERDWKYRLSVYYSKPQDSGVFTCSTPRGITNSISVKVIAVHCEPLEVTEGNSGASGLASGAVGGGGGVGVSGGGGAPRVPSIARVEGHRLGQTAHFHCPLGYIIDGPVNLTCRASGRWSGRPPTCVAIRCPSLQVDDVHLNIVEQNTSYGGRAVFRCSWGHVLTGPPGLECESNGKWSGEVPSCKLVECPPPLPPVNGRLLLEEEGVKREGGGDRSEKGGGGGGRGAKTTRRKKRRKRRGRRSYLDEKNKARFSSAYARTASRHGGEEDVEEGVRRRSAKERRRRRSDRYAAGSAVQFACSEGHHLIGEPSILCTEGGVWSHPPPFCKVRCAYPGDPEHGRLAPLKFFYEPGDRIAISCDAGFVSRFPDARPLCRHDGTWSEPTPACTNYQEV